MEASSCCNANLWYLKNPIPLPVQASNFKHPGQAVRSLPIRILTIGKKRSAGTQLLVEEYMEKLKYYCSVDDIQIRSNPKNTSDVKAQIEGEDANVMQHIRPRDWIVALDERGVDVGSEQMVELVGNAGKTGSSTLVFCIGGPYGHGQQLRKRADVTIRLSSMVLNHQIALIVLLEQLYRIQGKWFGEGLEAKGISLLNKMTRAFLGTKVMQKNLVIGIPSLVIYLATFLVYIVLLVLVKS